MSQEREPSQDTETSGLASATAQDLARSMSEGSGFVSNLAQAARAEACIGTPHTANGHTVVPIANVSVFAGFGLGFGGGVGGEGATQGQGSGGGGGGGGRAMSRVIAVIDVSEVGVEVRPVLDMTMLVLGFLAFSGLVLLVARGSGESRVVRPLARVLGRTP